MRNLFFSLIATVLGLSFVQAQNNFIYTPMDSLGANKQVLIDDIESSFKSLKKDLKSRDSDLIDIYESRSERLVSMVERNNFIHDDEINHLVNSVFQRITVANPSFKNYPNRLLVSRSPVVNASCWGEGTMVINLGLLNRINTEDELAFVMAHELAHQLLDHSSLAILEYKERRDYNTLKKRVEETGKLNVIKELAYSDSKYSRQNERQADSLGSILINNTKYQLKAYQQVLTMLDSSDFPKYRIKPDLKKTFNFGKYPFKDYWLTAPSSSFGQREANAGIFIDDSVKSHPDINLRIKFLDGLQAFKESNYKSTPLNEALKRRIDFEMAFSSEILENYGTSMFYTLQLLEKYPQNKSLQSLQADLLNKLYFAKKGHFYSRYIPVTNYYPVMMEEVFVFLNNLRLSELGQLAYHYVNRDSVFDPDNAMHYKIIYDLASALELENVKIKVNQSYQARFPDAEELSEWKN